MFIINFQQIRKRFNFLINNKKISFWSRSLTIRYLWLCSIIFHNFYVKTNYKYSNATNLYIDLQKRRIDYIFKGLDENGNSALQEVSLTFFNPKFGFFHDLNDNQSVYFSFSVAKKSQIEKV